MSKPEPKVSNDCANRKAWNSWNISVDFKEILIKMKLISKDETDNVFHSGYQTCQFALFSNVQTNQFRASIMSGKSETIEADKSKLNFHFCGKFKLWRRKPQGKYIIGSSNKVIDRVLRQIQLLTMPNKLENSRKKEKLIFDWEILLLVMKSKLNSCLFSNKKVFLQIKMFK